MSGAVALHREWLRKDTSTNVAVYVVWSPQLGAEEKHVAGATSLIPDVRARHYWDGAELIGKAYQRYLKLEQPAWDVWMLFDRDAIWRGEAPPGTGLVGASTALRSTRTPSECGAFRFARGGVAHRDWRTSLSAAPLRHRERSAVIPRSEGSAVHCARR